MPYDNKYKGKTENFVLTNFNKTIQYIYIYIFTNYIWEL